MIAVYSENYTWLLYVQNAEFLYVKAGGKYSNHFA
jgi:hypothetical protein